MSRVNWLNQSIRLLHRTTTNKINVNSSIFGGGSILPIKSKSHENNDKHYNNNYSNNSNNTKNNDRKYLIGGGSASILMLGAGYIICQECFEESEHHVTQVSTRFQYPKVLNKEENLYYRLICIGQRKMRFLNIGLYSVGIYINSDIAKVKLEEVLLLEKEQFCKNREEIKDKILERGIGVSIKIRPTKKVHWDHLYNGLQNPLIMILLKKHNMSLNEIDVLLNELRSAMPSNKEIPTTCQIDFVKKEGTNGQSGALLVLYNEKPIKEIQDRRLSDALFDFYLGDHSKLPDVRDKFFENLWLITREQQPNKVHISNFGF
ncbi:hypothetical protein DLAC_11160 [Tieghemostelium lacteum]|uniref:Chalcone isomerase domain-containing protein n=1 Tax=Tieghemostelium lacteum TaxID=361077 RepID=A0A151Z3B2_TIELA|nr:hypothetical protein DLAC_11160 [Tieghemostelium lacteum]|eukprot:KYQ88452.1 hypothetical protein DLAC_11160 [Tieghemostelium lacteum]